MILSLNNDSLVNNALDNYMSNAYASMSQNDIKYNNYQNTRKKIADQQSISKTVFEVTSIGAKIMQRAIKYTPVKTGALRNSIYLRRIGLGVAIVYDSKYALYVHEIGFYNHKHPTRYKFLEEAALEIALETDTSYRISISYSPLAVYVNIPGMGADIVSIKINEINNKKQSSKDKAWNDYINYDDDIASDDERLYNDKMKQFFEYWHNKRQGDMWILEEWQDRNRHD